MTPKRVKEIVAMLPPSINPRIGGSYNLYLRGIVDSYRDIDIIVDTIEGVSLPFPKIELVHKNRLNRTIKYCIDGIEVDIVESIFPPSGDWSFVLGLDFVPVHEVLEAKQRIKEFLDRNNQ